MYAYGSKGTSCNSGLGYDFQEGQQAAVNLRPRNLIDEGQRARALLSDRNPFRVCVPSQNGLLLEPPQRHKDMTAMVAIDSPLSPCSTTGPFTMYGPFSTH